MRLALLLPFCLGLAACIPATSLPPTEPGGPEGVARAPSDGAEVRDFKNAFAGAFRSDD